MAEVSPEMRRVRCETSLPNSARKLVQRFNSTICLQNPTFADVS